MCRVGVSWLLFWNVTQPMSHFVIQTLILNLTICQAMHFKCNRAIIPDLHCCTSALQCLIRSSCLSPKHFQMIYKSTSRCFNAHSLFLITSSQRRKMRTSTFFCFRFYTSRSPRQFSAPLTMNVFYLCSLMKCSCSI